ncbi:hypothetical protein MD484_g1784, partial [Candolleomyces efflorescens]
MATRARTRASAANASAKIVAPLKEVKRADRKAKRESSIASGRDEDRASVAGDATKVSSKRGKGKVVAPTNDINCTCSRGDDGSPMVHCAECKIWYHFVCVDLSERQAEDLMSLEGLDAFENDSTAPAAPKPPAKSRKKTPAQPKPIESEESGEGSEDEYVGEEDEKPPQDRGKSSKKRRAVASSGSESDASTGTVRRKRTRRLTKLSTSPAPNAARNDVKRKASTSEARTPAKRKRADTLTAADDPTRRYCLGKLEEMFRDIFFRHPHVRNVTGNGEGDDLPAQLVPKALDEMAESEKEALLEESKKFAAELEQCMFDGYAEHDKAGNLAPGASYKDRFRTMQFNLSKPDRVVIHRRITSGSVSPKELSGMSSTELADEETQQEIKQAEQEALEHSILQKVVAPRAKITHKGLQDIEFQNEPNSSAIPDSDMQLQREAEAEERRERERLARLKPVQRQRTMSMSVVPESPVIPTTPTYAANWGAPPPVPSNASRDGQVSSPSHPAAPGSLFIRTGSDLQQRFSPEPEIDLADFINIDEVSPTSEAVPTPLAPIAAPGQSAEVETYSRSASSTTTEVLPTPSPTTALSPFAGKQSFNLDTLWNNPKEQQDEEEAHTAAPPPASPPPLSPPTIKEDEFEGEDMVESPIEQVEDQDFDMFLQDKEAAGEGAPKSGPPPPVTVEALPEVWKGMISMPLDSSIPQETPLVARQIGGTPLLPDSLLWKTLFPADHLRIDGRVPIDNSAKYLLQMRLSSAKELYAVVLSPASEADEDAFKALSDFLTSKGRHGLVFPWGSRPKDHHPGRELYIIPLHANEPLPEYLELLDSLKLPKDRTRNYMVGIWILNKGKLAPPPMPPAPVAVGTPTLPLHPTPPNPLLQNGPRPPPGITVFTPPVSSLAAPGPLPLPMLGPSVATPPHVPSISPAAPAPAVDLNALAAEVATLTPEQIQNVVRTLQMSGAAIPSVLQNQVHAAAPLPLPASLPPSHLPPSYPYMAPAPPAQPWQTPTPPYPPSYPPAYPPALRGQPSHLEPLPPRGRNDDYYDGPPQHHDRDGYGQGGGSRGKGRGRGHGRNSNAPNRPVDSGWPRKRKGNQPSYDQDRHW